MLALLCCFTFILPNTEQGWIRVLVTTSARTLHLFSRAQSHGVRGLSNATNFKGLLLRSLIIALCHDKLLARARTKSLSGHCGLMFRRCDKRLGRSNSPISRQ